MSLQKPPPLTLGDLDAVHEAATAAGRRLRVFEQYVRDHPYCGQGNGHPSAARSVAVTAPLLSASQAGEDVPFSNRSRQSAQISGRLRHAQGVSQGETVHAVQTSPKLGHSPPHAFVVGSAPHGRGSRTHARVSDNPKASTGSCSTAPAGKAPMSSVPG